MADDTVGIKEIHRIISLNDRIWMSLKDVLDKSFKDIPLDEIFIAWDDHAQGIVLRGCIYNETTMRKVDD